MKKGQTIVFVLLSIIQLVMFVGYVIFDKCTKKFMGMNRFIVYQNGRIEKFFPDNLLLVAAILLLIIFIVFSCRFLIKSVKPKRRLSARPYRYLLYASNSVLSIYLGIKLLTGSADTDRFYYFFAAFFLVFLSAQFLKGLLVYKKGLR